MEEALRGAGRPRSVVLFEAASIIWAVADTIFWGEESVFGNLALLVVWVGLTVWVTRGRSRAARLIYTGFGLFSLVTLGFVYGRGSIPSDALSTSVLLVGVLLQIILLSLVWWPTTTAWLKSR